MTADARDSGLPAGSLVIERYEWQNPSAVYGREKGIQWLAQTVDKEGNFVLLQACETRKEALEVCGRA